MDAAHYKPMMWCFVMVMKVLWHPNRYTGLQFSISINH